MAPVFALLAFRIALLALGWAFALLAGTAIAQRNFAVSWVIGAISCALVAAVLFLQVPS